ncbi:MAG TPA: UbiA family prenyltransferase [Xanthobacteraceae bacterium]|nr:UbiA family prenyltransferase [Xanthobacteraceae bacterium]
MPDVPAPSRRDLWIHWLVYPGHSLPTASAPVLVAMGLAIHDHVFAPLPAFVGFLASWLIHIGGLFTDNYQLLIRHPAVNEHPELSDALAKGTLTLRDLRRAIAACFALAALTGPYLLHVAGTPVIAIGLLGMVGSVIYSTGPFPLGKLGLSDLHFFIMFGIFAPAAAYYVQLAAQQQPPSYWQLLLHDVPLRALIVGLPLGAIAVNILIIDDIRDRHFDAAKGWRTGPLRFGIGWSRTECVLLSAFIYLIPFWFWLKWDLSAWVLLPLLTIPFATVIVQVVLREDNPARLLPLTPMAALLCLVYSILLAIGIVL